MRPLSKRHIAVDVRAAEVGQLAHIAALRGQGWHQQRVVALATVHIAALELALAHVVQLDALLGQLGGDDLVHVVPGRGLLALRVHDDRQVGPRNLPGAD